MEFGNTTRSMRVELRNQSNVMVANDNHCDTQPDTAAAMRSSDRDGFIHYSTFIQISYGRNITCQRARAGGRRRDEVNANAHLLIELSSHIVIFSARRGSNLSSGAHRFR